MILLIVVAMDFVVLKVNHYNRSLSGIVVLFTEVTQ